MAAQDEADSDAADDAGGTSVQPAPSDAELKPDEAMLEAEVHEVLHGFE